ncbi:hypothetical protein VEZ01S_01_01720 [Vibrio ezurae NBRC 102218]|uniref:Uncharacterized protein n=1 Tax=Vibrio ezurae NBRC 102218 TaxID=1219080 RepID=U3CJL1_9VIBR|nr:hypothetical protein VEZ01S_01_01720 [Vibrio ezurae NBRC 102218]
MGYHRIRLQKCKTVKYKYYFNFGGYSNQLASQKQNLSLHNVLFGEYFANKKQQQNKLKTK